MSGGRGYGSDLQTYEIKSAKQGSGFEYQYHKNSGAGKLDEESGVDHIYIVYAPDYQDVTVRLLSGSALAEKVAIWRKGYDANYEAGKQRYRRGISSGYVMKNGAVIMEIKGGRLVIAEPDQQPPPDLPPLDPASPQTAG